MHTFFDEFAELLSISIVFDYVVIVGDWLPPSSTKELCCILDNHGLTQHVTEHAHNRGNTLELIKSKGLNISKIVVTNVALSENVLCYLKGDDPNAD